MPRLRKGRSAGHRAAAQRTRGAAARGLGKADRGDRRLCRYRRAVGRRLQPGAGRQGPGRLHSAGRHQPFSAFLAQAYQRSVPLDAIKALAPTADVHFRDGRYIADAVNQARRDDVAIVFATQWSTEGLDQPDLSLPNGQDALIEAVTRANPNTIVVLQTGGPVLMPWLDRTAAVVEAWYPGARGGEAIASVLFGKTNPSGHLPITFPAAIDQLPRKAVDGFDELEPDFAGNPPHGTMTLTADYDVEGADLGYRWNARKGHKALFPFGYGLSYTSFAQGAPSVTGTTASWTVRNTGQRAGATVAQMYLTGVAARRNGAWSAIGASTWRRARRRPSP